MVLLSRQLARRFSSRTAAPVQAAGRALRQGALTTIWECRTPPRAAVALLSTQASSTTTTAPGASRTPTSGGAQPSKTAIREDPHLPVLPTPRFNDDWRTSEHHMSHELPPQEWSTFHGKIPVLHDKTDKGYEASSSTHNYGDVPRTSLLMELTDRVGVLHDVLRYFWKYDVNVCRIESRPASSGNNVPYHHHHHHSTHDRSPSRRFDFFVDFEGTLEQERVQKLLDALRPMTDRLLVLDEKRVHWFPRHISELDLVANRVLEAGTDLESDHPGFQDPVYRARRAALAEAALRHTWDAPLPHISYSSDEISVWTAVWDRMEGLWDRYACREYRHSLALLREHCGYSRTNIPQQADISDFLQRRTQFRLRPVAGLLSSRDFLNGLAFRVFMCTQYIRHSSKPLYTPEPDICHELLGHVPMLADRDFADFSQEIGLASLGASDDDVDKLARCYWHSVEFGLCVERPESGSDNSSGEGSHNDTATDPPRKAYGAGLLSSFGELEYACSDQEHPGGDNTNDQDHPAPRPSFLPWEPAVAAKTPFPITTYQPVYFVAESLQDAKDKMRAYCEDLPRPFFAQWNPQTNSIYIDRPVQRTKGLVPADEAVLSVE